MTIVIFKHLLNTNNNWNKKFNHESKKDRARRVSKKSQNFDSTNGKIKNCELLSKKKVTQEESSMILYIVCDLERQSTETGLPTSRTLARKNQLKILANNRKGVSQRRLGRKLGISHVTICRQLSKINIKNAKIHRETGRESKQFVPTYYVDRHVAWFWTMKNILLMMAPTCKETTTTTRLINLNVQIVFTFLEKRNIRKK